MSSCRCACFLVSYGAAVFSCSVQNQTEMSARAAFPCWVLEELNEQCGNLVPDCSAHRAVCHIQVLPVSAEEIQEITANAGCRASPLLYLSQDSAVDFLKPVRIQLPLPPGVTGQLIPKIDKGKCHIWKTTNSRREFCLSCC